MSEGKTFKIAVGPVHPALKEPVQLNCEIEGEQVKHVDIELSQVHRSIEWIGTRRNPVQVVFLAEKICGICNICHTLCFCEAVESIAGIEVPARAHYIRTIAAELERIHSHILWAGVAAHELGFDSVMHYTWKLREKVLDTTEYLTGNRIGKAIVTIGGTKRDIEEKQFGKIREACNYYRQNFSRLRDIFLKDPIIKARARDIGILRRDDALSLCAVGPTARASGVKKDVRQDEAYAAYPDLDVKAITPKELLGEIRGDVYDRIAVRLLEVLQSVELIEKCLKQMPEGKIAYESKLAKVLSDVKQLKGEAIGRHEAPRGEVFHYLKMVGEETPYSWKVRAPTYNNILSWIPMLKGAQIADIPIVAASIDPCMSCTNRAAIADGKELGNEKLHRLSVEKTRSLKKGPGSERGNCN
ncbi:MAG: nickel-dependent hydrogenase large subunit [Candidatus Diapherotrites archaeon]|uniref:Nickel-dependent hydrogenase large subunit n=1 Tax=Candidatus Iainarchaeum sp. TaxID=3101447 RepID=A0A939C8R7_9ARCH|nr:nickel-dependent hydrogenase large subunit [Candidatus Diapherotrites archaeon]